MTKVTDNKNTMTDFERFIKDRGFEFETDEALRAGYDRLWKSRHGVLISQEEFIAEATTRVFRDEEELEAVYDALAELVHSKKLTPCDVYQYARFGWCLDNASAIVAYQTGRDEWAVNNCGTKVSEDAAKVAVNGEWGFEASRVKILGTPYYDSTDWQFIRFDCAHMAWLWKSGSLCQVYE